MILARGGRVLPERNLKSAYYLLQMHLNHCVTQSQKDQALRTALGETALLWTGNPQDQTIAIMRMIWGERTPPERHQKSAHYLFLRRRKHLNHCVTQSQRSQYLRIV